MKDTKGRNGMIRIAICEDEKYMLDKLVENVRHYIKRKNKSADIQSFLSGEELLKEDISFDILLLDLKLPGINGLEAAKRFCGKSQIIFVTAYQDYALDAFDIGAVHYLVKPITREKLDLALDRAVSRLKQMDNKALALIKNGKVQMIMIRDILYCEVFDHQICIHAADGNYEYFGSLHSLEQKLDERFLRCHRSFIVNMNHITGQENGTATVTGGDQILISRRKQQEFMKKLLSFLENEVI